MMLSKMLNSDFSDRFSAEETPFTVDSKGILRMFQRSFGYTWTPVLNLKAQVLML